MLNGTWDKKLEGSKVIKEALVRGKSSLEIGPSITLWKVQPISPEAEKYYCLTEFACALNELEDSVSQSRRDLHGAIDTLQGEVTRRYRTGEASVDGLLKS